jgi:hypothetical protein
MIYIRIDGYGRITVVNASALYFEFIKAERRTIPQQEISWMTCGLVVQMISLSAARLVCKRHEYLCVHETIM